MAKVNFKRIENSENIDTIDVVDGNFIITGDGKSYIDYGTDRIPTAGTPDTEMSDTSRNTVENKVIKEYVDNISSDTGSNYLKFGNILICWGVTSSFNIPSSNEVNNDITLPQTYKNNNYKVICSLSDGGAYWASGLAIKGFTLSTSVIRLIGANYLAGNAIQNVRISYITIGEWK